MGSPRRPAFVNLIPAFHPTKFFQLGILYKVVPDTSAYLSLIVSVSLSFMQTGLMSVVKDMKEDINKPYRDLHPIVRLFSWLLMR